MENTQQKETWDHKLYKHSDKKDADAIAWAFVNKSKLVEFPFKFPELGKNEIRANVLYSGLCHSDSLHCRCKWGECSFPVAPGHEIIAEVSQVGSEVKDFKKGDKVAFGTVREVCGECKYCTSGRETLCGNCPNKFTYGFYWGGYATQLQQPADHYFKLPDNLDLRKSAPLLCAGLTVYKPIKKYCPPGALTAVVGIGGLGHLAVQFLHKLGFHVTAITSTTDKTELIKSLGADEIVNANEEDFMSYDKFDFVINTSVSTNFETLLNYVAPGGTWVQVGNPQAGTRFEINLSDLVMKELKIVGSLVGTREDVKDMLQFCADKNIYPMVEEFQFEDFPKAFDRLENGKPQFRCLVDVGTYSKKNGLFK